MKLLYVYEFSDKETSSSKGDFLWNKTKNRLLEMSKENQQKLIVDFACGIIRKHVDGGTSISRLVNLFWMHLASFFKIAFFRPDVIFVRTTPPLIQLSYILWGRVFGAKVYLWLMDYHPVFGVRTTKHNSLKNLIWRAFDFLDKMLLRRVEKVVCLDKAMSELICQRTNGKIPTFVCPTFSPNKVIFYDLAKKQSEREEISLLYSGNLGRAHNTDLLEVLLERLSKSVKVKLSFCGKSTEAVERLKSLALRNGLAFESYPFVENYSELGEFYKKNNFDYGIVLLNQELAGVVSPSKFSGYSSFGLPIIYIGPENTNADILCKEFGAGVSISSIYEIDKAVEIVKDVQSQIKFARNTQKSIEYFSSSAGDRLAEFLYKEILTGNK